MCCNLIANVKLRFILFVPTFNNSIMKFAFVFILILVVCKVIENLILTSKSLFFSNQPYIKIFQQVETPMAHGNYEFFAFKVFELFQRTVRGMERIFGCRKSNLFNR